MQDKLQTLLDAVDSKGRRVDKLLEDPTQDNILAAQTLNEDIKKDCELIESLQTLRRERSEQDRFLNAPLPNRLHGGDVPGVVGWRPAGETIIGDDGGEKVALGHGAGLIDGKTWRAISEPSYKGAFEKYLRRGEKGLTSLELKALQDGSDQEGGFLVPEDFIRRLIEKSPTPTRVQDRVTRLTTGRDAAVLPKVGYAADDLYTTGIRATWTGEIPATSTASRVTDPTFGQVRIPIHTAMLSMPLTNNMVEDADFALQSWAEQKFSETIRLLRENMILNGSGIGQPDGAMNNAGANDPNRPAVVNIGNTGGGPTAAGLVKMAWSVPEQYDDGISWVMNKTSSAAFIAQLQDSNGRFLWGSGLQDSGLVPSANDPNRRVLQGYPVLFQGFMPNLGANAYPILFGDLAGYTMVDRIGFSIQVLRELYAETNQILLLGRVRFGGQVVEPWRLKIGKQA